MGDAGAIGGWILAAAVVTVLAGGATAVGGAGGSSGGTAASARPTTSAARTGGSTGGTTGNGTSGSTTSGSATSRAAARAAVPCTRVSTVRSTDGKLYRQLPVSAAGSYLCGLERGDTGRAVMVLQQALAKCSDRTVKVDGIFDVGTRAAVMGEQRRQRSATPTGVYGPQTAKGMRWPWFTDSTNTFTGRCAPA